MNIINDIREKQSQLILMINSTFDDIIRNIESIQDDERRNVREYASIYPITNTSGFKGKKPISVTFGNVTKTTPTWKSVVEFILKEVLNDPVMKERISSLCDIVLGRTRKRLSSSDENMRSPLKLDENLFIETHYDTETLMNLLLQILNGISYDYSQIKISIKN
ncbi:MAG: hypothetical protein J6B64_00155 [Bacilli bacterium]|nr:hypothetical protein [Bacilli bacterium]MBP3635543.1 hypothetical protein [Bacilli bacterium]